MASCLRGRQSLGPSSPHSVSRQEFAARLGAKQRRCSWTTDVRKLPNRARPLAPPALHGLLGRAAALRGLGALPGGGGEPGIGWAWGAAFCLQSGAAPDPLACLSPPPQLPPTSPERAACFLPSLPFPPCFSRESKMAPLPGILLLLLLCLSAGGPTVCALESETSAQDEAVHGRILPAHGGNGSSEGVPQPGPDAPPWPEAESSLAHPTEAAGSAAGTQEGLPAATSPPSAQEDLPHPGGNGAAGALEERPGPTAAASGSEEAEGGQPGCEGDVPPQKMHRVAEAMMQFTADLLRVLEREDPGGNLCFSPLSISLALAHLALGAANQTEKHLLEALHMESVPCLHQTLQALSRQLDNPLLNVAARLYLRKGFQVREKFLEDSERFYGAKPVTLSGQNDADLAAINDWVKETTQGQISTILSSLPASAVMVLLNAVHFKGFWRNKFDPALTAPGTFHLDEEFVVSVNMMKALKYPLSWFNLESLDVQVARFPFKGNTSLVAVVPNHFEKNVSQLLTELSQASLQGRFPKERPTVVKMPSLRLQHHLQLNQALGRLGLGELFSAPNFSGLAEGPLFVSSVEHQSALELAEAGVEASAATSVVMSRSLSTFYLDRPFLAIILDDATRTPLFVASIQNPDATAPRRRQEQQDSPDGAQEPGTLFPK